MAKCSYCSSTIIMGGVRAGDQRFCNQKCQRDAFILSVTKNVPADVVDRKVEEVWRGDCPKCKRPGPVDVHKVHEVWSALVLTRWTTKPIVSCRACATKRQLGGVAFSLVFGWWGFPWGLILTPTQITRNFIAMGSGSSAQASADLRKLVLVNIGQQMIAAQKAATNQPSPPKIS